MDPRALTNSPALPGELLAELLPIVGEVNALLDPEELLPTIARAVRRLVDYVHVEIFLPSPDGLLLPALVDGFERRASSRLSVRVGEGVVGAAAAERRTILVPDVTQDPRVQGSVPGVRSVLCVPLIARDRLTGVLNVETASAGALSPGVVTALQVLAGHLASAIANATLHREARWYAGLLATLYEIGKETASILDLDRLLPRVAEIVKRVIDYDTFGIFLLDEPRQELVLRKAVRYGNGTEKTRIPVSAGLCGAAVRTKEAVLVGDVRNDPRYLDLVPETRSELVVPLIHQGRVIGVFDLESPQLNRFHEEHVKILTPLASQVSVAIENARLLGEIMRRDTRLQRELEVAREIQAGLFPEDAPRGTAFEASAHFVPARELGGDLYDFYDLEDGVMAVAVGDVAGKGMPAALYGAFASGTVRARAFERHGPADLLARVNRTLCRRGVEGLFCTLAYAVLDFARHSARIASSGLPYPVRFVHAEQRAQLVPVAGLPLGMFDTGSSYDEVEVPLLPGDVLVLYTDGVTEAGGAGQEYGTEGLLRCVDGVAHRPAADIGEAILADVRRAAGGSPPADDVTLVVIKVRE